MHRDLKPDNVFLTTREDLVKVLDFGIAKIVGDDEMAGDGELTAVGTIVGTPVYMSPEAAAARGGVGPSADLYSLGVMLFEMLTGRPPFTEDEPVLLLGMHLRARPPLLREAAPEIDVARRARGARRRAPRQGPGRPTRVGGELVEALEALGELSDETLAEAKARRVPRTVAIEDPGAASRAATPGPSKEERASVPAAATPPPATATPSRTGLYAALAVVALAAVGGVAWWSASAAETSAEPAAAAPPEEPAPPEEETVEAPEEEGPGEVRVVIRTVPATAEIAVDGMVRDNPYRAMLRPGDTFALRVRAAGFEEHTEQVTVSEAIDRRIELAEREEERPTRAARARREEEPDGEVEAPEPEGPDAPPVGDPLSREEARARQF